MEYAVRMVNGQTVWLVAESESEAVFVAAEAMRHTSVESVEVAD